MLYSSGLNFMPKIHVTPSDKFTPTVFYTRIHFKCEVLGVLKVSNWWLFTYLSLVVLAINLFT